MAVTVSRDDFDVGQIIKSMQEKHDDIGAIVSFSGVCRGEKGALSTLTLECYAEMAKAELEALEEEAHKRFSLIASHIHHRYGKMHPKDNIVLVVTLSVHRKEAFAAAEFLMDFLKTQAPFWKLEEGENTRKWVEAKAEDDEASARW
jgi:molybdopterin synthase catalytic subunit